MESTQIILMADVLSEKETTPMWHAERILSVLKPSIASLGRDVKIFPIQFNTKNEQFNPNIFFMKSGLKWKTNFDRIVDFGEISTESITYFEQFFNSNQLIIGWELQKLTIDLLEHLKIPYINIWLHPIRFLEDEIFLINSNLPQISEQISHFEIDETSFFVNAEFVRSVLLNKKKIYNLRPDSCVIFGQTRHDKTLRTAKHRLSLFNYKTHIQALCNRFQHVYFVAHPLDKDDDKLKNYIASFGKIETIEANAYSLLASPNLSLVAAISSSVCTEAHYFGKNALFFNQPVCDIKKPGHYSVDKDIFTPMFWQTLLGIKTEKQKKFIFSNKNQVREILNAYYSYTIMEQK